MENRTWKRWIPTQLVDCCLVEEVWESMLQKIMTQVASPKVPELVLNAEHWSALEMNIIYNLYLCFFKHVCI